MVFMKIRENESVEEGLRRFKRECERFTLDPASKLNRIVGRLRKERRFREIEPLALRMGAAEAGSEGNGVYQGYQRLLSDLKGTRKGEQG